MNDEVSEMRRAKAQNSNQITPRDALLEAMTLVEGEKHSEIGRAEHVLCIVMTADDDGVRSFMVTTGGSRNHDELLGVVSRVQAVMAMGGGSLG